MIRTGLLLVSYKTWVSLNPSHIFINKYPKGFFFFLSRLPSLDYRVIYPHDINQSNVIYIDNIKYQINKSIISIKKKSQFLCNF